MQPPKNIFLAVVLLLGFGTFSQAQETESDTLNQVLQTIHSEQDNLLSEVEFLKRLKISGYMQAQWQLADTAGINSFSGGNFPKTSGNRFGIRRGRIKFTYDNELSNFVLQLDATEKGVAIKDAYVLVREPWLEFVTLTAGVFDRPFGYEIGYSSGTRETPERARAFQSLFPGERDLGAKITLQPRKGTRFDFIKLDAGLFAGNGINSEFDSKKDFIGHLGISKANTAQTLRYGLGASYYNGGVFQGTKHIYNSGMLADGVTPGFVTDSSTSNKNAFAKREYTGFDAQLSIQWFAGITTFRAEYLFGKQPGSATSNVSLSTGTAPTTDTYNRKFNAGYVYLIQNIGESKHQLVIKYDWYDPNTLVSGKEIASINQSGTKTFLTTSDVAFNTLGMGWNYRFNSQVKFTVYYEIVKNEKTSITGSNSINDFARDLDDNVLTLRVQYKF